MDTLHLADLDAVQAYSDDMPARWVTCRELGHVWNAHTASVNRDGGFDRALKCSNCDSLKNQVLDSRGCLISTSYTYTEGYQLPKGTGRITSDGKGIFRLAALHKQIGQQAAREKAKRARRSKKAAA